jgi:hypothetical protein
MLQKLSDEISECYRRAEHCRLRAKEINDPLGREDFLDMERRWLHLEHSYEFTERLTAIVTEVTRRRPKK